MQVKAVIAYAAERFILVVPEIELPGHSCAAIACYPHLSCESHTSWGILLSMRAWLVSMHKHFAAHACKAWLVACVSQLRSVPTAYVGAEVPVHVLLHAISMAAVFWLLDCCMNTAPFQ